MNLESGATFCASAAVPDGHSKYPGLPEAFNHPIREVPASTVPPAIRQMMRAMARQAGFDAAEPIVTRAGRGEGDDHTEFQSIYGKAPKL